jgi:hypothetical protein
MGQKGLAAQVAVRAGMGGMAAYGAVQGYNNLSAGVAAIRNGDPTGYVDILTGAIDMVGGIRGLGAAAQLKPCFVAGTPIRAAGSDGSLTSRPIESLRPGDLVQSRSEFDPAGPLALKRSKLRRQSPARRTRFARCASRSTYRSTLKTCQSSGSKTCLQQPWHRCPWLVLWRLFTHVAAATSQVS